MMAVLALLFHSSKFDILYKYHCTQIYKLKFHLCLIFLEPVVAAYILKKLKNSNFVYILLAPQ